MAKPKGKTEQPKESLLEGLKKKVGGFFGEVGSVLGEGMKGGAEVILELIHKKIDELKADLQHKINYTLLLWVGGIFLLSGVAFFLNDIFLLPQYVGFFAIGIIILVIGYVYKSARK